MQSRLPLAEAMLAAKEGQFEFASCEKNVVGDAEQQIEGRLEYAAYLFNKLNAICRFD